MLCIASDFLVLIFLKNIIKIGSRFFIKNIKKVLDMDFLFIYEQILIFCKNILLIYEEILKPREIGRFAIIIIRKKVIIMALNMTKKELDQLASLKKKQRAVIKQRAEFKKQILENKEFVLRVLKEDEASGRHFVDRSNQGGPGVHPGI